MISYGMNSRLVVPMLRGALMLVCLLLTPALPAVTHVSVTGSDTTGDGSRLKPYQTLQKALAANDGEIWLESGQYIIGNGITVPANVRIRGSHKRIPFSDGLLGYALDAEPTILLALSVPGQPAIRLGQGAGLEWLRVAGGFNGIDMGPGSYIFEVTCLGSTYSSVFVNHATPGTAARIDRSRILGGSGIGIRIDNRSNVNIVESLVRGVNNRGIFISGEGTVTVVSCVVQNTSLGGIQIFGNRNVAISNSVIRRTGGNGVSIVNASPVIQGNLIEQNDQGLDLNNADGTLLRNNTITRNRRSGIQVTESQPDILNNIIAANSEHGVFENKIQQTTDTLTLKTHVRALRNNLFHGNGRGAYWDEGTTLLQTAEAINGATNVEAAAGNVVADPMFVDASRSNYRLQETSPAIDILPSITGYIEDLDGSARAVDVPDVGAGTTALVDLGAYEFQTRRIRNFGTEFSTDSFVPDEFFPGRLANKKTAPEWEYVDTLPYKRPVIDFLPGRFRFTHTENETFAPVRRVTYDFSNQPWDKVQKLRVRIAATAEGGRGLMRVRTNGPETFEMATGVGYVGDREYGPKVGGTDYFLFTDYRQGGYRDIPASVRSLYRSDINIDILDFLNLPIHTPQDVIQLELEELDRVAFDATFTQTLASWTFNSAEPFVWASGSTPEFPSPRFRFNPAREALQIDFNQANAFGWWNSPEVLVPIGRTFRIQARLSTPQTSDRAPSFRLRVAGPNFIFSQELLILSFANQPAGPKPASQIYTMYGYMPPEAISYAVGGRADIRLFVDLWGFPFDTRPPEGTLYIEDVTISTTPN